MKFKQYVKRFFVFSLSTLFILFSFSIVVDPYDVTGYNLLNIKYKFVRDNRLQKINQIKKIDQIDNLILGSSRAERLNPKTVDKILGGFTYSFAIGGANMEDALGLILYLEKQNKLPKNIILCVDFSAFKKSLPTPDGFYKIPEINFLNEKGTINKNFSSKLFSLDAIRSSFKTFKRHIKNELPDSFVDKNGFLVKKTSFPSGNIEHIKNDALMRYDMDYKKGNIEISEKRFNYLRKITTIAKENNISLYIMLTPLHEYLYNMMLKNEQLSNSIKQVKNKLLEIHPYYDAMILDDFTQEKNNFSDAVHTNIIMGDILLKKLLTERSFTK